MKKLLILVCLLQLSTLFAERGCMSNSWNRQREYDNKEYHHVECSFNCLNVIDARGECLDCGHFRMYRPLTMQKKVSIFDFVKK